MNSKILQINNSTLVFKFKLCVLDYLGTIHSQTILYTNKLYTVKTNLLMFLEDFFFHLPYLAEFIVLPSS